MDLWGLSIMPMTFDSLLEEIETLPSERQETLVEILHHRLQERRRQEIARHAKEAREVFYAGRWPRGTVDDLVREAQITMQTLVEQLIQSPKLPSYLKQFQEILAREQQKREAFYQTITEADKAEFINGEVVFQSPVKFQHDAASGALFSLIRTFVAMHDLGYVGHEKIMISLTRNDYEPDICFFSKTKSEQFLPEQTRFPAPDFIVEVLSDRTEANDRGTKFEDYAAHGVGEYWLVDPSQKFVEQYILRGECYELLIKSNSGNLKSAVITGFEVPIRAIFDEKENLKALQEIVRSV